MSRILRTEPAANFSRVVEYHGFVFTQGLVATNPEQDLGGQTRDVLAQLDAVLEQHGTDNTRLLQVQIWLARIADRGAFNEIWSAWLPPGLAPARALVEARLADPRFLVEIMATAGK